MNELDRVSIDDDSSDGDDLSEIRLINLVPNLHVNNIQYSSADILLESLILQICRYVEDNAVKQKRLFNVICDKLHELCLLGKSYKLNELQYLREKYMAILQKLILAAKCLVDIDVPNSAEEETALPLDTRIQNLRSKLFDWSRYAHEFCEMDFIARGGFGQVYRAHHILDDCDYAVKKIFLKYHKVDSFIQSLREVQTLARLNHPNIVAYKAAWLEPFDSRKHNIIRPAAKSRLEMIEGRIPRTRLHMIEEPRSDPRLTSNSLEIEFKDSSDSREFLNSENNSRHETTDLLKSDHGVSEKSDTSSPLIAFQSVGHSEKSDSSSGGVVFKTLGQSDHGISKKSEISSPLFQSFSQHELSEKSDTSSGGVVFKHLGRNEHDTEKSETSNGGVEFKSFSPKKYDISENSDFSSERIVFESPAQKRMSKKSNTSNGRKSMFGKTGDPTDHSENGTSTDESESISRRNSNMSDDCSTDGSRSPGEYCRGEADRGGTGSVYRRKSDDQGKERNEDYGRHRRDKVYRRESGDTGKHRVEEVGQYRREEELVPVKQRTIQTLGVEKKGPGNQRMQSYFFPESQETSMDCVTMYIQMQLCQITLKQWLGCSRYEKHHPHYDKQVRYIFRQIVQGLDYIHSQGIVHHDIKPSNIFVSHDLKSVQVGDFGLACCLLPHSPHEGGYSVISAPPRADHPLGTRLYAAPEQLHGLCDPKSDVYSLGIVLFEMLINFSTDMEKSKEITKLKMGEMPARISSKYPHYAKIIPKLLDLNPKQRPSASQILTYLDENQRMERLSSGDDKDLIIEELQTELDKKMEEIEKLRNTIRQMEKNKS